MILRNDALCVISIKVPFTEKEIEKALKRNVPLSGMYSTIDITPLNSADVPDIGCETDFVKNLIDTGSLTVMGKSKSEAKEAPAEAESEPVKTMTAKEKKEFDTLVIDAEIEGVDVSGCTTLKEVKAAMKKAGK